MPTLRQRNVDDSVMHLEPPRAHQTTRENILLRPRKGPSNTHKLHTSRLRDNVNNSALAKLRKMLNEARSTMRSTGKGPMRRTARRTTRRTSRRTARRRKRKNRR